ncbi:MAG: hypothetical protein ACK5AS_03520 [Bacteroidota bacterium]|jgi:hypothetical protein
MKKNLIYLAILIVSVASVYYFIYYNPNSTLQPDERTFAFEDTASVAKIFISDMNGTRITFVREQNGWKIQETGLNSRKDVTDLMLRTIKNLAVRYPVSKAAMQNAIKDIATHNKKIELYDKQGERLRSFLLGPPAPDGKGNFILAEQAETPYVVWNTGFVGSLESRFSTDVNEVRSRIVLSISFQSLAEITVQHSNPQLSSFSINVEKPDSFLIRNTVSGEVLPNKKIDKSKVFEYIDFLKAVYCEVIVTSPDEIKNALEQKPFCTVTLRLRNGSQQQVMCYYKEITQRSKSQTDEKGNPRPYDLDRFYGVLNGNKDVYLLQDYHFGKLIQTVEYFKKSDS